jgi:hypothetical protein
MLVPSEPRTPTPGPLRRTLAGAVAVLAVMSLAAIILWAVTSWLWLVVHEGLH